MRAGRYIRVVRRPGCQPVVKPGVRAVGLVDANKPPDGGYALANRFDLAREGAVIEQPSTGIAVEDVEVVVQRVTRIERHPRQPCAQDAQDAGKGVHIVVAEHSSSHAWLQALTHQALANTAGQGPGVRVGQAARGIA